MKSPRLWCVVLLMSFTALVVHVRGDVDRVLPSTPLSQFPTMVAGRTGTEVPIDQETRDVLGKGDFMDRIYSLPGPAEGDPRTIDLFIGYFPTQRSGQSIHSPQNCLPGAGWTFISSTVTTFTDTEGKQFSVGDYIITNQGTTEEALYWYQMHGRSIASDYKAKMFTLADSIRYGRTDAALVRIITPIAPGESRADAHDRAVDFARHVTPLLPAYVPN